MADNDFASFVPMGSHKKYSKSSKKIRNRKVSTKKEFDESCSFIVIPSKSNITHKKESSKEIIKIDEVSDAYEDSENPISFKCSSQKDKISIDMKEYNIFHIDDIIKKTLISRISTLSKLENELQIALEIINGGNNSRPNGASRAIAQQKITLLRRKIQDIESTFELNYYIHRSADILENYRKLTVSENSLSFVCCDKQSFAQESSKKNILLRQYITIAQEYINTENCNRVYGVLACPSCKCIDMSRGVDDDTSFVCRLCGTEIEILDDTPSFKDTDRVNMSSRYTYSRRGHFIEAMKKYQGKHNIDSDALQVVVRDIKDELRFHNLKDSEVTKDHLYMFLAEKKLSNHYVDINLLYHIITGNQCPEFSHLENSLLELFETQEKALNEVTASDKDDDRINSINVYYKLYKLLQFAGYPCKKSDFHILKTKSKEDEHDEKLQKAWAIFNWEWIGTF